MSESTMHIQISEIDTEYVYPRESPNEERIKEFKEQMECGELFEPVKLVKHGDEYVCLDGVHRIKATEKLEKLTINSEIVEVEKKYWLLNAAFYNYKTTAPLKRKELKNVIVKSYHAGINDNDIVEILQCSPRWVRKLLSPYKSRDKEEQKKKAQALKEVGKSCEEISDILGVPLRTVFRWIKKSDSENLSDTFEDIKKTFNKRHWGDDEKNTFLCIGFINKNLSITDISKALNVSNAFVFITAFLILLKYREPENENEFNEDLLDDMGIAESRVNIAFWLFNRLPKTMPEREFLYEWMNRNNGIYTHAVINQILGFEKVYWVFVRNDKDPSRLNEEPVRKITPLKIEKFEEEFENTISYVEQIKMVVEGKEDIEKEKVVKLMEQSNRLMVTLHSILKHLQKFI